MNYVGGPSIFQSWNTVCQCDNNDRSWDKRCNNIVSYEFLWTRTTCAYIQLNVHYCVLLSSKGWCNWIVSCWSVVMHTYLYYFPLSSSLCRFYVLRRGEERGLLFDIFDYRYAPFRMHLLLDSMPLYVTLTCKLSYIKCGDESCMTSNFWGAFHVCYCTNSCILCWVCFFICTFSTIL